MNAAVAAGSDDPGPEFVQSEVFSNLHYFSGRKAPIFLIHDGGGTTFTYHLLEAQGRFVYAIGNPHWETGKKFEGGIPEMGRIYAGYIREAARKTGFPAKRHRDGRYEILLGGWSLGGLLSLEVASQLVSDPRIKVTGVVMIDSVYYQSTSGRHREFSDVGFETDEVGKSRNQILAQRAMTEARRMISSWKVPTWGGSSHDGERPRTVLLRAVEHVPTKEGEGISMIDEFRDDPQLGWGNYMEDFLEETVDITGNHFTLAEHPHVEAMSIALKRVCERLDVPRR